MYLPRFYLLLTLIISVILILSGCKKDDATSNDNSGNTNALTLSTYSLSYPSFSGSQNLTVFSNVNWSITDNASWISVNPTSGSNNGSISVSLTENTSSNSRSGSVTISGGGLSQSLSVNQSGNPSANLKGTITFYKPNTEFDAIELSFQGSYIGVLGPGSRYQSSPGCFATGCINIDNLSYGTYTYKGEIYNAAGTAVVYEKSGSVTLNSSCVTVKVDPK